MSLTINFELFGIISFFFEKFEKIKNNLICAEAAKVLQYSWVLVAITRCRCCGPLIFYLLNITLSLVFSLLGCIKFLPCRVAGIFTERLLSQH